MHVLYLIQEYYVKSNTILKKNIWIALVSEYQILANNRFLKNNLLILYGVRDSIHFAGIKNVSMKEF